MILLKTLAIAGAGAGVWWCASKIVKNVYLPVMRHDVNIPFPRAHVYKSALLSKLAYHDALEHRFAKMKRDECIQHFFNPHFCNGQPLEDAQAYIWNDTKNHTLYVSFRGTMGNDDILADIDVRCTLAEELGPNVRVHCGFFKQFASVQQDIETEIAKHDFKSIVFCGHSLGAAVASIAAVHFALKMKDTPIHCFTVGSPRVGNDNFRLLFNNVVTEKYRIFNENDPVPMVPISHRFVHVDNGICITDAGEFKQVDQDDPWFIRPFVSAQTVDFGNLIADHDCELYIKRLRPSK